MNRRIDAVIAAVCRLPVDFEEIGQLSAVGLLERSGYLEARGQITGEGIAECLAAHPDWVDAWFGWSADKRTDQGWYIRGWGPGDIRVGYHRSGLEVQAEPLRFHDKVRACAESVHREVEDLVPIAEPPARKDSYWKIRTTD